MKRTAKWLAAVTAVGSLWSGSPCWAQSPDAGADSASEEPMGASEEPMRRYPPSSTRVGLIAGGIGITGAAYGLSALSGTTWDDVPGADALLIPVVGPWIALFQSGCAPDDPDCGAILVLRGILYVIDGFAQAGGVGLVAEGIFMTTEADEEPAEPPAQTSWSVAPMVTPRQVGLGVVGTF